MALPLSNQKDDDFYKLFLKQNQFAVLHGSSYKYECGSKANTSCRQPQGMNPL